MILIRNRLRALSSLNTYTKQVVQVMLAQLSYETFDISITLTTNATIKKYNATYREKNKSTDILSFPYHPNLKAGDRILVTSDDDKTIGDIIISVERTLSDAKKYGLSFEQRFDILLAHGIAHLLGHDHITDEEFAIMQVVEKQLLRARARAYIPFPAEACKYLS